MRLLLVLLLAVAVFVTLANLAVIWNGALFVLLIGPFAWSVVAACDWAGSK